MTFADQRALGDMTPEMAFECLLVCRDPAVYCPVERALRDLSILTNSCLSSSKAIELLAKENADLIVIDWEGDDSLALLERVWASEQKPKPTIIAICGSGLSIPGAHVLLHKPISAQALTQSLRTAYSRMLLEHRKNVRYPLMIPLMATDEKRRTIPLSVKDIGDGGVGLKAKEKLAIGGMLSFRLQLPGAKREIYAEVRVVWSQDNGNAGCEFLRIPPLDVDSLYEWLKGKARVKKPLIPMV